MTRNDLKQLKIRNDIEVELLLETCFTCWVSTQERITMTNACAAYT